MQTHKRFSVLLLVFLLAACVAAPTVPVTRRYTLEPVAHGVGSSTPASVTTAQKTLVVAKVILPGYLNRQPIVHRKGSKILVDDYQLWAEPLMDATPRILVANMVHALPEIHVVQQSEERADWKLFVRIERYEAVDDRAVELDARWSLVDKKGKTVMSNQIALEQLIPDGKFAGDDLSDVVNAHGKLLAELSEAISRDIRPLAD